MTFRQRQHRVFTVSWLLVSLIVLAGCGGGTTSPPTVIQMTATRPLSADTPAPPTVTSVSPTETSAPEASPTPAPEASPTSAETRVTFEFVSTLSTGEEVDHIRGLLEDTEGILAITGTEVSITITYDPNILTVEALRTKMEQIGYPVKAP